MGRKPLIDGNVNLPLAFLFVTWGLGLHGGRLQTPDFLLYNLNMYIVIKQYISKYVFKVVRYFFVTYIAELKLFSDMTWGGTESGLSPQFALNNAFSDVFTTTRNPPQDSDEGWCRQRQDLMYYFHCGDPLFLFIYTSIGSNHHKFPWHLHQWVHIRSSGLSVDCTLGCQTEKVWRNSRGFD